MYYMSSLNIHQLITETRFKENKKKRALGKTWVERKEIDQNPTTPVLPFVELARSRS